MVELAPLLLTAFFTGILSSTHCMAMCGGIAASVGVMRNTAAGTTALASPNSRRMAILQINLSRILMYTVLGLIVGGLGGGLSLLAGAESSVTLLRLASAALLAILGVNFLTGWPSLAGIERAGALLWNRIIQPRLASRRTKAVQEGAVGLTNGQSPSRWRDWLIGMAWGSLPCGLVYTMLLMASTSGGAIQGAAFMLAYGAGTLPSMLAMGVATPRLLSLLRTTAIKRWMGVTLLVFALWTAGVALLHSGWLDAWPGITTHHGHH